MKIIGTLILAVCIIEHAFSQSICSSEPNKMKAMQIQSMLTSRGYYGYRPMLRLALHRITRANGTGGFSWTEIDQWVSTLPTAFADADICFTVISKDAIASNTYFNLPSFKGNDDWVDLIGTAVVANAINIYFVDEANSGGIATNWLFDSEVSYPTITISRTVSTSTTIFNTQVLAHEMGHVLGLYHTNEIFECVENIQRTGSGANCTTCGDFLCDTEADPGLGVSLSNVNDATCAYIGGATQSGTPYTPNTHNIMSYSLPHCLLDFTTGQINRMKNFIYTSNTFDDYVVPYSLLKDGIYGPGENIYIGVEFYLAGSSTLSSGLLISGATCTFEAGGLIKLQDGFTVTSGSTFTARIANYSCVNPALHNFGKNFPSEDAQSVPVYPSENKISLYPTLLSENSVLNIISTENVNDVSINVFDISGALLEQMQLVTLLAGYSTSLKLSPLSSGCYIVQIKGRDSTHIQKIVIQ